MANFCGRPEMQQREPITGPGQITSCREVRPTAHQHTPRTPPCASPCLAIMTEGTRTRLSLVGSGKYTKEGLLGTGCGILYGLTSPLVGHPIDTGALRRLPPSASVLHASPARLIVLTLFTDMDAVKTKMQAQDAYMKGGALRTMQNVVRQEGFLALWRGLSAPLAGSMVFRSVQFGVYNARCAHGPLATRREHDR